MSRDNMSKEQAESIENNYKVGFKGVADYQSWRRKEVMKLGYIETCPELGMRTSIYDFDRLNKIQKQFNKEYWNNYRYLKENNPTCQIVQDVKYYFKRKSTSERQSINYTIQARGSAIFKIAIINLFKWIVDNNYFGIVKFCIPVHDEINVECPKEIAEIVDNKLDECMVNAGKFICRIVPLSTDVSLLSDNSYPSYWIH